MKQHFNDKLNKQHRKGNKAASRRRNNWMPGFASFTAQKNAEFKRNRTI